MKAAALMMLVFLLSLKGVEAQGLDPAQMTWEQKKAFALDYLGKLKSCTQAEKIMNLDCAVSEKKMCLPPACAESAGACVKDKDCRDLLVEMYTLKMFSTDTKKLGKAKGDLIKNELGKDMMGCMMTPMNQLYFSPCGNAKNACFYPFAWCHEKCQTLEVCKDVTPECEPEPEPSGAQLQPLYFDGAKCTVPEAGDFIGSLTKGDYSPKDPDMTGGYAQFRTPNLGLVKKMAPCWDEATKSYSNCPQAVNDHHQDVERTFVNYATDYTRKMDKVQNGIEGLAQLHSTHDEMWHRICAIAERGAKYRMQEFKQAIQKFKSSMIDFKGKHTTMLEKKAKMEAAKVKMTISLQKWLTARKAHAAAHTRYVNFLHHLGLDFNDKNPAARYWREYSHGVTGGTRSNNKDAGAGYQAHGTPGGGVPGTGKKNPGGKVFGGWTPLQGPIPHLGQHSHKVFIDKLESIAQPSNRVGIFEDPKNHLHDYVMSTGKYDNNGGRERSGNPDDSVVPSATDYGYAQAGQNMFQTKLMDIPFYNHMARGGDDNMNSEPTNEKSVSGLEDFSQQTKHNKTKVGVV